MNRPLSFFCLFLAATRLALVGATTIANPGPVGRPQGNVSVLKDSNTAASNGTTVFGGAASTKYMASRFTAATSYTLTRVDVYLDKIGSPTFNITASIYTDNAGNPGTLIGSGSTNSIGAGSVTGSEALYSLTGLNATINTGIATTYFIVFTVDTVGDITNHCRWHRNASTTNQASGSHKIVESADASTWSTSSSTRQSKFATYGY